MKIAVSTAGTDLDSLVGVLFGRAKNFLIIDEEQKEFEIKDNIQNLNAVQGAGIQAAKNVIDSGASVIITGHCGPKAFKVLEVAGVKVFCSESKPIKDVLDQYAKGSLEELYAPDVEGHH